MNFATYVAGAEFSEFVSLLTVHTYIVQSPMGIRESQSDTESIALFYSASSASDGQEMLRITLIKLHCQLFLPILE